MNTVFESPEHFRAFRAAWKAACNNPDVKLYARDYALQALLRNQDLRKHFSPITNPVKLANGQSQGNTQERAVSSLLWEKQDVVLAPYAGTVTYKMFVETVQRYRSSKDA